MVNKPRTHHPTIRSTGSITADLEPLMRSVKGFVSYTLASTDGGGISVTTCQDQAVGKSGSDFIHGRVEADKVSHFLGERHRLGKTSAGPVCPAAKRATFRISSAKSVGCPSDYQAGAIFPSLVTSKIAIQINDLKSQVSSAWSPGRVDR